METRDSKLAQFTHPSDFEKSSIPGLADLDNVLRCQVCKDYFETPSTTSCSHTFCSMCIRQALSSSGQCPTCRKKDQTTHLRRNWPIQEAVAAWKKVRADVLAAATRATVSTESVENEVHTNGEMIHEEEQRTTRSAKKRAINEVEDASPNPRYKTRSRRSNDYASPQPHSALEHLRIFEDGEGAANHEEDNRDITPTQAAQASKAVKVSCPICDEEMLESYVFGHLDHCDGTKKSTKRMGNGYDSTTSGRAGQATLLDRVSRMLDNKSSEAPQEATKPPPERITFLSYDMMKEAALKKKLQQLGIRTDGNKALMKARHMYWVDLWNANADSDTPRSRRELLDDLAVWERAIGRNQTAGPNQGQPNAIMRKDFDREGYQTQNTNQFNDLIAQARNSVKSKATATPSSSTTPRPAQPPSAPIPAESMFLGAAAQLNAATAARRGSNAIQYLSSPIHLQHSSSSMDSGTIRQVPMYHLQEHAVTDMDEDMK